MSHEFYPVIISALPKEDGGGFIAICPDLAGCMSVGETPEEALAGGTQAVTEWIAEAKKINRVIPEPGSAFGG